MVCECYGLEDTSISFVHDHIGLLGSQVNRLVIPQDLRGCATSNRVSFFTDALVLLEFVGTAASLEFVENQSFICGYYAKLVHHRLCRSTLSCAGSVGRLINIYSIVDAEHVDLSALDLLDGAEVKALNDGDNIVAE